METIDYASRADLVAAIVDFRKRGVHTEVVHSGLTLSFPDGIDPMPEDQEPVVEPVVEEVGEEPLSTSDEETLLGVVQPEGEPLDRSTFTVQGTCSECGEAALAEPDGSWIHVEAAIHGDNNGQFVPNVVGTDEVEDLIGTNDITSQAAKRKRK